MEENKNNMIIDVFLEDIIPNRFQPRLAFDETELNKLADSIKKNLHYVFVKSAASEQPLIYVYVNGYYKFISDDEMKGFIKSFIPYQLRNSKDINEVLFELKTEMNFVDYEDLNNNEDIINFQDGLFNIRTNELMPHTPEILSTIQIPAKYREIENAPADAPIFSKYVIMIWKHLNY